MVPLPLSPGDLQARLPELLRRAVAPSPRGLGLASSLIDPVTGFYVFQPFKDLLFVELKQSRRYGLALSVALIGVDPPAWSRSPKARERLMAGLALAVRRSLRDTDYAVQYSADPILLVMPHTELAGAVVVAERIGAGWRAPRSRSASRCSTPPCLSGWRRARGRRSCLLRGAGPPSRRLRRRGDEAPGGNRIEFYNPAAPPDSQPPR